jgi:hypothetical protein
MTLMLNQSFLKLYNAVSSLPREVWEFATEVAIGGGLRINWSKQIELIDDCFGA